MTGHISTLTPEVAMTTELAALAGEWIRRGYRRDAALNAMLNFVVLDLVRRGGHEAAVDTLDELATAIAGATGQFLVPETGGGDDDD